jgi:hypothetical protein
MVETLYVIGNGFDLHHGIPSSYKGFGEHLRVKDAATFDVVQRYFDVDADFWADFEARLASLDSDALADDASEFLVSYGADGWSDAYHHAYQFEISEAVEAISVKLRARFADWIRQLPLPDPLAIVAKRLTLDPTARFLNFNYTPSLQRLYGVADTNILHIHGAAIDPDAQLILGHGWVPPNPDPWRFGRDPEAADTRVMEGQGIIDKYFQDTFKPTAKIIGDNAGFFGSLTKVERIVVMGHSISEVDHPYFKEMIRNVDIGHVRWKISCFSDLPALRDRVASLGIALEQVEFAPLPDF